LGCARNEKSVVSWARNVKVTLGMCVKNSEAIIRDAIDSVLNQDYPHENIELIVVDGYSKDNTLNTLKDALRNTDIDAKIFQEKEGLGQARQMVVDNALGEYIIWVDADLILSNHFITNQVEFMSKNPDVGIAKGKYGTCRTGSHENLVETLENTEFLLNTMSNGETTSKALGTSGCIYRVKAIRQVGGFDQNFKGAGEDQDAEYRVRAAGWSLHITQAVFYEKRRQTWSSLWNEYFWHGYGGSYLFKKNRDTINIYKFLPPVAIVLELLRVPAAYKLTKSKATLLLPFHYIFKRIAWYLGFMKSRADLLFHEIRNFDFDLRETS
jgi:glycosyltransferase involved in cell wall biosynthesis